ncbi:MAG TPA: hypothetical protein VIS29_14280 [Streptomyces sp.]
MVDEARAELVTAVGISVEPVQSTRPGGEHVIYFGHGRGWLRYHFSRRTTDPQIVIDECFWQ